MKESVSKICDEFCEMYNWVVHEKQQGQNLGPSVIPLRFITSLFLGELTLGIQHLLTDRKSYRVSGCF